MAKQANRSGQSRVEKEGGPESGPAGRMGRPERDEVYDLISVLYHALQGAETYEQYIEDARRGRDEQLVTFFERCRQEEHNRAKEAKELLVDRLEAADEEDEGESGEDENDEDDD